MVLAAALSATLVVPPAAAGRPSVLFRITDDRIDEASGIAVGQRSPGVVYVQNDSGDSSRFFALDARTGRLAATVRVEGALNIDWEDLAVADDRAGTPSVWLADIGDNDGDRDEIDVYRVDEPNIAAGDRDRRISTDDADVWRLRYPGGATADAESLAVTPDGVGYLVTKSLLGGSVVYRLPTAPDADRVQNLSRVADIAFRLTGTPGGPSAVGQLTATGAAFSRDGRVFAVRTYTDAYVWPVTGGDLAAALRRTPVRIALPRQPQGEGVAIDGTRLLVDSEGVDQPVYAVPLPSLPTPTPTSPPATTAVPTNVVPTNAVPTTTPAPDDDGRAHPDVWYLVGGAAVLVLVPAAFAARRRRDRRS